MAKKYVIVRMPIHTYDRYKEIQCNINKDLKKITGKEIKLPMTKVLGVVVNPNYNENFIQVDLRKLAKVSKKRGGKDI